MSGVANLGSRVRLRRLQPSELPHHPHLTQLQSNGSPQDPRIFARDVLMEAKTFITDYWPKRFSVKSPSKKSSPSVATVEVLSRDIPTSEIPQEVRAPGASGTAESWFARSSIHENKKEKGTAGWDEFEGYLLDNHSEHEKEYTPDVYDAFRVLQWDAATLQDIPGWEKVEMLVFEMCHSLPTPLNPRCFSVLVVKARATSPSTDFLTVQIPVDIAQVSQALYSNGRNRTEGGTSQKKKPTTPGSYVSIERAELLDDGKRVKWQMATASDAGGNLPMWAQKMGVPGAVTKDVGLFMGWVADRRG
ncbi:hypothetical protein K461DRAFT_311143 [Myriangium duriaei CBS 260.36]|uniref:DUF3074 domain-containing protein n=1 Tax=Myriangium duriaei CBS 260.36 TaxID=1168546 RepID=A0A9P4J4M4_9PEZI|nr:hypothetical protein K461DRAFT_311143 [Myriangium duriaei CBS 260.36]